MSPKVRSLLARITLVAGVALVGGYMARHAPHEQTLVIRLPDRDIRRVEGVVTELGSDQPSAGFSVDFPESTPKVVRHAFSAPSGTYIIDITLQRRETESSGGSAPKLTETTFQRRVSLAGGEVIVSPD